MEQTTLLLLVPVLLLELAMKVAALVSLSRAEATRGPKVMWVALILFVSLLGWAGWFAVGRRNA